MIQNKAVIQLAYTYNTSTRQQVHCPYINMCIHINGTIPQVGIDLPAQSHATYKASALPQAITARSSLKFAFHKLVSLL